MFWFIFIVVFVFILFFTFKHALYLPLNKAQLSNFDSPIEPNLVQKEASDTHKTIEKFLLQPDPSLNSLSKKDRLLRLRKTMDDGGVRIEIPAKIIPVNCTNVINTKYDLLNNSQQAVRGEWVISPTLGNLTGVTGQRRILYIHGGAFYLGSPQSHRIITNKFSEISNAAVFSVDYRLRPEHSRLSSLEDCKNAYLWLLENGPEGKSKASDIIIAGDSAGGNLCLSLLTWIRDENLPSPEAAICISPVTDSTLSSPSIIKNLDKDAMLQSGIKDLLKLSRTTLLIGGWFDNKVKLTDPRISPLFGDLHDLPPTLIQVSDTECLEDDARRYTNKAREAGSDVTLQVWANMMHVWHTFEPELDEAKEAFTEIEKFISQLK